MNNLIQIDTGNFLNNSRQSRPGWLKVSLPQGKNYVELKRLVRDNDLHTVCESAACPNIGECWNKRHLTFMILGNVCTRGCGFCDVVTGKPTEFDLDEPRRVADAIKKLSLDHVVITSVNRDELPDGGSKIWAETIRLIKVENPDLSVEVLIPDFKGDEIALRIVLEAKPDILAHNIETVPALYRKVRPQAIYEQSLEVLQRAKSFGFVTKAGLMLGLGEAIEDIRRVMYDLCVVNCDILTLGQYLQPSKNHLQVVRFYHPEEFDMLRTEGEAMGFRHVESAPLVRSSYHADRQKESLDIKLSVN